MSTTEKIIEIAKREHADITEEHMKDILSIADKAIAELAQLHAERNEMREAHKRIKEKSELWIRSAENTTSTHAVPPWWNLGDISAAVLAKYPEEMK